MMQLFAVFNQTTDSCSKHKPPTHQHTLLLQTWLAAQQLLPPRQTWPVGQQLVPHCCTRLQQVRPRKHVSVLLQQPPAGAWINHNECRQACSRQQQKGLANQVSSSS
jgi:hypothetical protein